VVNDFSLVHALLGMAMRKSSDERAVKLFQASRGRVRVIALFHAVAWRGGTDGPSATESGAFLAEVVHEAERARGDHGRIRVGVETNGVTLGLAEVVAAGLVVNELVTNALCHAFPDGRAGLVTVTLSSCEGEKNVLLRVSDDGIGFSPDDEVSEGLGLPLVRLLAEQLSAELVSRSAPGTGSDFSLRFPSIQESLAWQTS
jgi:two-component sensor histidine kinase